MDIGDATYGHWQFLGWTKEFDSSFIILNSSFTTLMLTDLTVKDFLNKVAGSDPVPGGGSIAALNGALASALAATPKCKKTCRPSPKKPKG